MSNRYYNLHVYINIMVGGLQCTNGILRHNDGILEICKSDEWWRVCSSEWGNLDTAVACKQLGYDGNNITM